MFKEYKELNFKIITKEIIKFWEKNEIFIKSICYNNNNIYNFYEGPPSTNGEPGIHHIMSKTIKDVICRFQTLKGNIVKRQAGWDTHGLPIELEVEKNLNISKENIGVDITISRYNTICKEFVKKNINIWNKLNKDMGFWLNIDTPYITYHSKYIETIWWLLKKIYNKNILYKGYTIQPYSPSAGTGISYHELNFPGTYKNIVDKSVTVLFKAKKNTLPEKIRNIVKLKNIYFLSWTTTPWTLPSNSALSIGKEIDYSLIYTYNIYTYKPIYIILASKLINKQYSNSNITFFEVKNMNLFNKVYDNISKYIKIPYIIMYKFKGHEILGSKYYQLIDWINPEGNIDNAFQVVHGDFVNINEGTGIVHIAPTFGLDDYNIAKKYNLPLMLILDKNNIYVPLVTLQGKYSYLLNNKFAGCYIKNEFCKKDKKKDNVDEQIANLLKLENKLFNLEEYEHSYPHCWRTNKPIIYYPLNSWIIKTSNFKKKMVDLNNNINWYPNYIGEKRFSNWLNNINDWNISRSRYWGTPIPIWTTKNNDEQIIIGSIKQLIFEIEKSIKKGFMKKNPFKNFVINDMSNKNYSNIDLHKHVLDEIVLVSSLGNPMKREEDVIDVWFDSGAMPYASIHYPFENKNIIDNNINFPADFIAEGIDQTRGWFYTLHAISTIIFDSIAFKNVVSNGLVLDKNGQKMSKSKRNTVNPFDIIKKYGPDSIRWYMMSNISIGENLKLDLNGILDISKKIFSTLYNTYSFFAMYANIDKFFFLEKKIQIKNRHYIDRWIISILNKLIKNVNKYYKKYNITQVARDIQVFIEKLSNWYIRICRRRFWKSSYNIDKISAYQTLYECLITIAKLCSPISPFFSDRLYQDLNNITKKEKYLSVHLSNFPSYKELYIDKDLEEFISITQKLVSMSFSLRKKENLKVRQTLQKIIIFSNEKILKFYKRELISLISKEVNVKEVLLLNNDKNYKVSVKRIKINFKLLGPKFGNYVKLISNIINNLSQEEIKNFEEKKEYIIILDDKKFKINLDEVEINVEKIQGWSIISDKKGITVALDINLNQELLNECFSRSLIKNIQNLRKDLNLKINQKIDIFIDLPIKLKKYIEKNKSYICNETLASNFFIKKLEEKNNLNIEGHKIKLFIKQSKKYNGI